MKMDRNQSEGGTCKYAAINLRKLKSCRSTPEVERALEVLKNVGALEAGGVGQPDEFFLIKLKDRNAKPALFAYADSIEGDDSEFASEVRELAKRSGTDHPLCKRPD